MTALKKQVTQLSLPQRDILGIRELSAADIGAVLDLADFYVTQNRRKSQTHAMLKGLMVVNLFLEPSTRTRLSFEIAAKRLGADVVNVAAEGTQVHRGESFGDTLRSINAMLPDVLVLRHGDEGAAHQAAKLLGCPVVNAGDGTGEHPTQALLDALTLRRRFGRLEDLKIAICGDVLHNCAAHSNILLLEKMGAEVSCIGPKALLPEDAPGATEDMAEGLNGADAVMVLRVQKERISSGAAPFTDAEYFSRFGLTAEKLSHAKPGAMVMHPGPMNRGVEIDAQLADDPERSLITTQVEMGVAVRMACLDLITRSHRR